MDALTSAPAGRIDPALPLSNPPRERPILFRPSLVRAILDGRKTETRRLVTVPWVGRSRALPHDPYWPEQDGVLYADDDLFEDGSGQGLVRVDEYLAPYGRPGDRLWVREAWRAEELENGLDGIRYLADDAFIPIADTLEASDAWAKARGKTRTRRRRPSFRPSIHMPRWAARILLRVTAVRVERLQSITDEAILAEGLSLEPGDDPRAVFARSWDAIQGSRATWKANWKHNPWVWVVTFEKET